MIWVDDDFADHPKFIGLDGDTITTWLRGIGYCNRYTTDGRIPTGALANLARCRKAERCAAELVRVGLWEKTEDGWLVHDFADYQFTKAESEARKAGKAAAGKKGAEKRWGGRPTDSTTDSKCHGTSHSKPMADGWQTDSPSPFPSPPSGGDPGSSPAPAPPAEKPKRAKKKPEATLPGTEGPDSKPPNLMQLGFGTWRKAWEAHYGRPYPEQDGDGPAMQRAMRGAEKLLAAAGRSGLEALQELAIHRWTRYLQDPGGDGYLRRTCHRLLDFERGVAAYGTPWDRPAGARAPELADRPVPGTRPAPPPPPPIPLGGPS